MGPEVLSSPLTLEQLQDFLHVQPDVVLVGGQALAFWADYYGALGPGYETGLTRDLDFFGTRAKAELHARELKARFPERVRYTIATMDTPPPSAAVILVSGFEGQGEPLVIDYVTAMAGYHIESERQMLERTPTVGVAGVDVRVMHPFDCLKSRIHNLAQIPSKRGELGVEQARTAIRVVHGMLQEQCAEGWANERRISLRTAEAVIALALHRDAMESRILHDLDVLEAIPVSAFNERFRNMRWPQARAYVDRRYDRRRSRVGSLHKLQPHDLPNLMAG